MTTTYPEKQADKEDAASVKDYTRVANMLIFGYRNISPQEKWLYVCLKHMCGKKGTRHLALRYISQKTGISTGALSTSKDKKGNINLGMIRHLHDAGLIHSEIKKHDGKGNAQYHITITDIWTLNQEYFATCPNSEQDACEDDNLSEFRTDSSEFRTDTPSTRPKSEQTCPNSSTILRLHTKITDITKITEQDESIGDDANAHHATLTPLLQHPFILLDDLMVPTLMVVKILSLDASTDEDKRRIHIASWELMPVFLEQGLKVELRYEYETDAGYPPSNHSQQASVNSYSQQGTTGNPLLENGEDHVLLPDHDHDVTGLDSLHADPDTRRATQAGHLPLKKNNNENHSHEEIDHGLFDGTPTGGVGAGHTPDAQASSRCGPSQSGEPDPGRLPVVGGTASGDVIQGVRGKARAQASTATATAARGRGAGHATDAVSDKVAPHQGSVQTDATPSLSVENPVVVGGKSNPIGEESKPTRGRRKPKVLAPEQMTRVNKVYDAFDALAQEVSDDPDFHYSRTKKTTQAISEWLTSQPTEKLLRETYKKLANTPADPKSGFSWAENLSIEAVLRQCDKRRLSDSIKNKRLTDNHVVTATKTAAPKLWVEEEEEDTRPVILLSRLQEARRNGYATPTFH